MHLEELPHMDGIVGSFLDIDGCHGLLHLQVLFRGDGMVVVACHIEGAGT